MSITLPRELIASLKVYAQGTRPITVLTGAGISAESGIPTFRGPEGYWTVGSRAYHPQEMATYHMFSKKPHEVWKWYLYRLNVCADANPNQGHLALVEMENLFLDRFTLITQNVDGLHLRAGNSLTRTYQIHGNVFYMRCARNCSPQTFPISNEFLRREKDKDLDRSEKALLVCPLCKGLTRPHVLWFDETYNEEHFYFHSSLQAAEKTALLIIVGTSGATNLPNQVAWTVKSQGGLILDINIEENPFSKLAASSGNGYFLKGPSGSILPQILKVFKGNKR
jgi:NAD-dependent deacetylase